MNVAVIGVGYVGVGTAIMLAQLGHRVTGIDVDPGKIERLSNGQLPIFEPGLEELLRANRARLNWTTEYTQAVPTADVIFICVGTPTGLSGTPDLGFLESAATSIAQNLNGMFQVIVNKSTVPVGSGDWVRGIVEAHTQPDHHNLYAVVSNPEFLREGSALADSLYPDRVVLGTDDPRALDIMRRLYAPLLEQSFEPPRVAPRPVGYVRPSVVTTTLQSAEMIKYAANAFLALKISFANEIAGLCEHVGADVSQVMDGIGRDQRIGRAFLNAGAGWGGSCFGKDTQALISTAADYDYPMPIVQAAVEVNRRQRARVVRKLQDQLKVLKGKRVAVLGLAFKPNTDDLRDAPAHDLIKRLITLGARVVAHDPVAMPSARLHWADLEFDLAETAEAAVFGADAVVVATEWPDYAALDWRRLVLAMRQRVIVDARDVIEPGVLEGLGVVLERVGRPTFRSLPELEFSR